MDDVGDDDDDWDLDGAVRLDDLERVSGKRHLRESQDNFRAKNCKVPGTVGVTFKFSTALINEEAPTDAGPSTELLSVKDALATAHVGAKEAKEQRALLLTKYDALENGQLAGSNKAQATCKEEKKALPKQAETAGIFWSRSV